MLAMGPKSNHLLRLSYLQFPSDVSKWQFHEQIFCNYRPIPNYQGTAVLSVQQCRLSSFQMVVYKIGKLSPKNQYTERKLLNFENWCNEEVSKATKLDFQSQFCTSKIIRIIPKNLSLKNMKLEAQLSLLTLFV